MDRALKEQFIQKEVTEAIVTDTEFDRDEFPNLWNLSSAFLFGQLPVPKENKTPEFVFLQDYDFQKGYSENIVTIAEWNMVWEVAHLRSDFFWQKLPSGLDWLKNFEDINLYLVPDNKQTPYSTYEPFLHILPIKTRQKFGLPLLKKGKWPFTLDHDTIINQRIIKRNFTSQLSKAFAYHIWPILDKQNRLSAFSSSDSLSLLAHNLKFWMPYLYAAIEDRIKEFGRVEPENKKQIKKIEKLQKQYKDIDVKLPLMGGTIWQGEDDAWEMTKNIVSKADADGNLSAIVDSIKSNRIQDDFSAKWSYAKEDFERKLYSKRNKVKVSFVEIDEKIPIHSPTTEIEENILWDDLLSIVDKKERRIIICLRKGITNHKEISELLGYKNHSPVTKKLKGIRDKAAALFDIK